MRFARLTLERYGRFEDCSLTFRPGAPDLHVIYGPNEAGKSTTLAAVSDLLFGFGARTPYDFRFDKALLRIGAELEEDGRTLVCRRRKGNASTLLDTEDRPIDEAMLMGMLRGQTRDGFRLAFSLDQERLRLGGRAMVEAKDDVGQALFAAGSGLTEVARELELLNEEADAIWGRRGAKRLFAVAEREHLDAQRLMRDSALKPKAWTDARTAAERSKSAQAALEDARDLLAAEQRRVERVRRVGPGLRRREELLASIEAHGDAVPLTPQREAQADAAMVAADAAERQRTTATTLMAEAQARAATLADDEAVLAAADRIDDLAERRGAFNKATQDRARLIAERRAKQTRIGELQQELGGATVAIPSRIAVSRLRELARRHAEAASGVHTMGVTVADLAAREKPLRDRIADATLSEGLTALVAAVDAAYRVGSDVDARCDASARDAVRARSAAELALKKLAPWTGSADLLNAIGNVSDDEIDTAQRKLADLRSGIDLEGTAATRLDEEAAALALERTTLAHDGQGVPADALITARSAREEAWLGIAEHLRGGRPLTEPSATAESYELTVTQADGLADLRFASAQASGRLAELDSRRATLELQAAQSRRRRDDFAAGLLVAVDGWNARTTAATLPELEPLRLRSWLGDRQAALDAIRTADEAGARALAETELRATVVKQLTEAMPAAVASEQVLLAPVLAAAETLRREGETRDAVFREDRAELREVERMLEEQRRRLSLASEEVARVASDWNVALAEAGVELAVTSAEARLAIFEELRAEVDAAAQLDNRLSGINTESSRFEADVGALAREIGEEPTSEATDVLTAIRRRLESGRDVRRQLSWLASEIERRQSEMDVALAARMAAIDSVAPIRAELGLAPEGDLAASVEASRSMRALREELGVLERELVGNGDGYPLLILVDEWAVSDPDDIARRVVTLNGNLAEMNARVSEAASASGEANRAFSAIEGTSGAAADAAADAEQARAEMAVQAEAYLLKRTQALMLRWAMDQYRERRQDPLLVRASQLFAALTRGRYIQLRVDLDGATPRLGGLCEDGRTIVEVGSMSEGTTDQLFLALRLAAMEQSVAAGVRLPFLADDLFVNFDDERAEAGFRVLAELAHSTQVLFFTHHPHLAALAARVVGVEMHSECTFE